MRYTVVNTFVADHQLAEMWLNALDRQQVADAFDRIEAELRRNPHVVGREHPDGWRVVAAAPFVVAFIISEDDRLVKVLSLEYRP